MAIHCQFGQTALVLFCCLAIVDQSAAAGIHLANAQLGGTLVAAGGKTNQ
jgi:hypothetical protein